jgi:putative nucleotidyltransferase with HDIG domain
MTDACLAPVGLAIAFAAVGRPAAALLSLPLSGLLQFFARDRRARMETAVELSRAYRGTALLLGDVIGDDDAYTGSHSRDVVELAMAVGPQMGLDEDQLRRLEFAALLHDVGKIAIPKEIINKPGQLDTEEWSIMRTHTIAGQKMLDRVGGFMTEVGKIIRSHHERWDGGGYPDGLAGEEIPLEARIITCCDAWNAMRTDRVYRKALSYEVALAELLRNNGSQFDPRVVAALLRVVAEDAPAPDARTLASAAGSSLLDLGPTPRRSEGVPVAG